MRRLQSLPQMSLVHPGALGSHCSPTSTVPLPQGFGQSESLVCVAPDGQHPSPLLAAVISEVAQDALHCAASPASTPGRQGSCEGQDVGQLPSQTSPGSTALLPHVGLQSLSLVASAPEGQQPSPLTAAVIAVGTHSAPHPEPLSCIRLHPDPPGQLEGQFPSHFSPDSITLLPQTALQSLSFVASAPDGQQPSPLFGVVMGIVMQAAAHADPMSTLGAQASVLEQAVGHLPSQTSPGSTTLLPQIALQSLSVFAFAGQQASPL
jgi:hypothetical protein